METRNINDEFKVQSTNEWERKQVKNDYLIAVNNKVKRELHIGKYAIVKRLFENNLSKQPEWRTIVMHCRVVVDDDLNDDEVAMDQTIRNSLGITYVGLDSTIRVRIARLKMSAFQKFLNVFCRGTVSMFAN